MANPNPRPYSLLFLSLLLVFSSAEPDTIHSVLVAHGLPAGLLPRSVKNFSLDASTGLLSVRLDRPCQAEYDRSPIHFDQQIEANLTYGGLRAVTGLIQEELFVWLPVKEISVPDPKSGVIYFDIGLAHKQLSASIFENPPECRPVEDGIGINDRLEIRIRDLSSKNKRKDESMLSSY